MSAGVREPAWPDGQLQKPSSGWKWARIKHIGDIRYGLGEPPSYVEEGTPLIRATNVSRGRICSDGLVFVNPADIPAKRILWLKPYDIVVVRSGAYTGDSAIVPRKYGGSIAGFDMVLRVGNAEPRFVQYALLSRYLKDAQLDLLRTRAAQPHLNSEELGNCRFLAPPVVDQENIADFLDRETAKIDALIAKQEQLVATLQEDRIATITHAVTRGLDSEQTVPGESVWVGRRPRTWTDTKMKYLMNSVESGTSVNGADRSPAADELGVLKTSAVSTGSFVPTASKTVVGEEVERLSCPVRAGTLLVNRANSPQFVGSAAYVDHAPENLYLSDKIWQFNLRGVAAEFVHLWTLTPGYRAQIESGIVGTSSSMQNVSMADYRELALAVPDLAEQRSIVLAVRAKVSGIVNLVNKSTDTISTLREYRSALITDAVTGKIDVREMV